jgi:hypothetical protein
MLALLLVATLAAADPPPTPATTAPVEPPAAVTVVKGPDPTREKICKVEQPMGSRLPKRVCKTAYEWATDRAASLRMLDQMNASGRWP